jgi:hypothetical protein
LGHGAVPIDCPACRHLGVRLACGLQYGIALRKGLPSSNRQVRIDQIDLDRVSAPAELLCRQQSGAGAQESVEHDLAAMRTVPDCIGHQRHRLDGRVHGQLIESARPEAVHPWIGPDVGARAPVLPQPEGVDVSLPALLEHEHELMLRAIKAALTGVALDPDADILQLIVGPGSRSTELIYMAPVHAHIVDGAIDRMLRA